MERWAVIDLTHLVPRWLVATETIFWLQVAPWGIKKAAFCKVSGDIRGRGRGVFLITSSLPLFCVFSSRRSRWSLHWREKTIPFPNEPASRIKKPKSPLRAAPGQTRGERRKALAANINVARGIVSLRWIAAKECNMLEECRPPPPEASTASVPDARKETLYGRRARLICLLVDFPCQRPPVRAVD